MWPSKASFENILDEANLIFLSSWNNNRIYNYSAPLYTHTFISMRDRGRLTLFKFYHSFYKITKNIENELTKYEFMNMSWQKMNLWKWGDKIWIDENLCFLLFVKGKHVIINTKWLNRMTK